MERPALVGVAVVRMLEFVRLVNSASADHTIGTKLVVPRPGPRVGAGTIDGKVL